MKTYNQFIGAKKNAYKTKVFAPNVYPPTGVKIPSKARILLSDSIGALYYWTKGHRKVEYHFQWHPDVVSWMNENLSTIPEFDCHGEGSIYCKNYVDRTLFQVRFPDHAYKVYSWDRISLLHRCLKWVRDHL